MCSADAAVNGVFTINMPQLFNGLAAAGVGTGLAYSGMGLLSVPGRFDV
jgi:hypothetical protein